MKREISFPDWASPTAMIIARCGRDEKRPVWNEYTRAPADWLSLRVTVEIAGGSPLFFAQFETEEEKRAARLEEDRRAAWRNAIVFAEQLWHGGTHREFVVMFQPGNSNIGPEAVRIYQRLRSPVAEGDTGAN